MKIGSANEINSAVKTRLQDLIAVLEDSMILNKL